EYATAKAHPCHRVGFLIALDREIASAYRPPAMNTIIRLAVVVMTIAVVVAARAEDLAATGKVLVLDNLRVLEGDVTRVEDQYRIARPVGETFVPAAKVLVVCPDMAAAYRHLQSRSDLRDAGDRLRLARWCHANGLTKQ